MASNQITTLSRSRTWTAMSSRAGEFCRVRKSWATRSWRRRALIIICERRRLVAITRFSKPQSDNWKIQKMSFSLSRRAAVSSRRLSLVTLCQLRDVKTNKRIWQVFGVARTSTTSLSKVLWMSKPFINSPRLKAGHCSVNRCKRSKICSCQVSWHLNLESFKHTKVDLSMNRYYIYASLTRKAI